ncbi:MarR family winged helix-turn-helix transcriptional regulator [Glycomyces luteolus]|uniref:MarR family winged helix-turn-helix transcriptional regulator n=1 Tax=Glycomyces luteolus TaxID=2670330 RepID=A0A9X3PB96_9ACTN|nr:MarR family winged helix-turn-helix transcriptional regulator [Glycomyces luteolus]MDA1360180.1 MarR family winged helix-turn-helix transcriptional regulator [Glycomyces luteolus]
MVEPTPGYELPLQLFAAFRAIIDAAHADLARHGHPDVKPMHGFVFQAIGTSGTTAVELGKRLGISKQAAGKTIAGLEQQGYVERAADPGDARRKLVRLTAKGVDMLAVSARSFDAIQARWAQTIGPERLAALQADLRTLAPGEVFRLDIPGWFGADR